MANEEKRTFQRLDAVFQSAPELPLDGNNKYAVMSDVHLGDGGQADNFHHNEQALMTSLKYYRDKNYSLVLLGDIEDLWQFDLEKILDRYGSSIYKLIRTFPPGQVHRVFGNHDSEWGAPPDPIRNEPGKSQGAPEGLKLVDGTGKPCIFLVHGYQGTTESDKYAWISRFAVRALAPVEWIGRLVGIEGAANPSSPDSQVPDNFEVIRYSWAKKKRLLLICGHSHRAMFASKPWSTYLREQIARLNAQIQTAPGIPETEKLYAELILRNDQLREERERGRDVEPLDSQPKPCYFNTGCCVYAKGPTCIELESGQIRLVKWTRMPTGEGRRDVFQEGVIADFLKELS